MKKIPLLLVGLLALASYSYAQEYRSLKDKETHVRSGPGSDYPVIYKYKTSGLPLKLLKQYQGFSQIKDYYGNTGWIIDTKLRKKRNLFVFRNSFGYDKKTTNSAKVFEIMAPNILELKNCGDDFCKVEYNKKEAYVLKSNVWGF